MTASLYQVAASSPSTPILRNQRARQQHDVRRRVRGIQLDVVPAVRSPREAAVVEEVLHAVRWVAGASADGDLDPARLLPARVQVDDHHDRVAALLIGLRIREEALVVRLQEAQRALLLERPVLPADLVDLRDERAQAARLPEVPVPYLVLLRVQVLLAAGGQRRDLDQLEAGAED